MGCIILHAYTYDTISQTLGWIKIHFYTFHIHKMLFHPGCGSVCHIYMYYACKVLIKSMQAWNQSSKLYTVHTLFNMSWMIQFYDCVNVTHQMLKYLGYFIVKIVNTMPSPHPAECELIMCTVVPTPCKTWPWYTSVPQL